VSGSPSHSRKRKRLLAPREEIAWFPVIESELCNGCEACLEFCRPGVFAPGPADEGDGVVRRPKMTVANPYNCFVLCTRCEPVCPFGAITLPPSEDFKRFVEYVD
jgi:NAD-dependent dihydropyrimidine dehydrogenase PreA subunit